MSAEEPSMNEPMKAIVKCIHEMWYSGAFLEDPAEFSKMHKHLEVLWNAAGIESTLAENNPQEATLAEFEKKTGVEWN